MLMMAGRQASRNVPSSGWPTRVGRALAGLFGGLLFLYFLLLFVGLWMRTGSFSPFQIVIYFGTPVVELLALVFVLFMTRHNRGPLVRDMLLTVWLANVLNMVLASIGFFTF
jgi:hypothetical protein